MRDGWRGLLLCRDELSGWLAGMDRYSGGGDRAFWLEAFGGRSYGVDRKNAPEPIIVDHLSVAVLGGTQPDKLDSLLVRSDDDGLLARFLVTFPSPAPLMRPSSVLDDLKVQRAFEQLRALEPVIDDDGSKRPYFLRFQEPAQDALQEFREQCRAWEKDASGIMKSHVGKLPGLAVRVATVLALQDSVADAAQHVTTISAAHFGRGCHYVGEHLRQHAFKAYGAASLPPELRAASRVAEIIRTEGLRQISTREIQRRDIAGLQSAKEIGPAFAALENAAWISQMAQPSGPGRPAKVFAVNPKLEGMI